MSISVRKEIVAVGRPTTLEVVQIATAVAPFAQMMGLRVDHATLAMLMGHELGFGLVASLNFIYVIQTQNGLRPAVSSQGMNALIQRSAVLSEFNVKDLKADDGTPVGCTVKMVRADSGFGYEVTFTLDDAERAGLLDKHNWQTYPEAMLRARTISACARVVCPDVIAGLYTAEELGAETDKGGVPVGDVPGETVEGQFETQPPQPEVAGVMPDTGMSPEEGIVTFTSLTAEFTPAQIMAALGGRIPASNAECKLVYDLLKEAQSAESS